LADLFNPGKRGANIVTVSEGSKRKASQIKLSTIRITASILFSE